MARIPRIKITGEPTAYHVISKTALDGYVEKDFFVKLFKTKAKIYFTEILVSCLAYIVLNPIRAGIVDRPEDYRWSSIGYHLQTNNQEGFLSLDFGLNLC